MALRPRGGLKGDDDLGPGGLECVVDALVGDDVLGPGALVDALDPGGGLEHCPRFTKKNMYS